MKSIEEVLAHEFELAMCMQVGFSTGQVSMHVVTPGSTKRPTGNLPAAYEVPVATVGTAIPPCHSPVACLSARCLHACDLDTQASLIHSEPAPLHSQRAAAGSSGPRVLAVRHAPLMFMPIMPLQLMHHATLSLTVRMLKRMPIP